MKTFLATFFTFICAVSLIAGEIPASEAKNHIGDEVTVRGTVAEVKVSAKATFLDIDGKYPNQVLTIVSFSPEMVAALKTLNGKSIGVTGTLVLYKGKPEIMLHSIDQITN